MLQVWVLWEPLGIVGNCRRSPLRNVSTSTSFFPIKPLLKPVPLAVKRVMCLWKPLTTMILCRIIRITPLQEFQRRLQDSRNNHRKLVTGKSDFRGNGYSRLNQYALNSPSTQRAPALTSRPCTLISQTPLPGECLSPSLCKS